MYHGYHICKPSLVLKFKELFCKQYEVIEENKLGALFENPVMAECNIVSQSVSYLRLLQFERYFTDKRDCGCNETEDHKCLKYRLHHIMNLEGFKSDRE